MAKEMHADIIAQHTYSAFHYSYQTKEMNAYPFSKMIHGLP